MAKEYYDFTLTTSEMQEKILNLGCENYILRRQIKFLKDLLNEYQSKEAVRVLNNIDRDPYHRWK